MMRFMLLCYGFLLLWACSSTPLQNSSSFVSLKEVASAGGFEVQYQEQKAILIRHPQRIIVEEGNPFLSVNGKLMEIAEAPQRQGEELFVPESVKPFLLSLSPLSPLSEEKESGVKVVDLSSYLKPIPPLKALPQPAPANSSESPSLKGITILLDPGHGGKDPGSLSRTGKACEKVLVLTLSQRIAQKLQAQGISVRWTRTDDRFVDLKDRIQALSGITFFVSVHLNSFPSPAISGYEAIYQSLPHHEDGLRKRSKALAEAILKELQSKIPQGKSRGLKQNDRRLYVLKNASVPAVLLELGFISNPAEEALLHTSHYQELLASAVAEGILSQLPH